MGYTTTPNSYQKMQDLSMIPYPQQLAIAVPEIRFYKDVHGLLALCPFHNDKSVGSFVFNPKTGVWKCFACGESGQGVISLLMKSRGWNFLEAVDYMYAHRNDVVAEPSSPVPGSLRTRRKVRVPKPPSVKEEESSEKALFTNHGAVTSEEQHLIYKSFAEASPLTPGERQMLMKKRGLSPGDTNYFFRMPAAGDELFWVEFVERLRIHDTYKGENRLYYRLLGTPGFYWDEEENAVSFITRQNALGILLHSPEGLINGIEMRVKDEFESQDPNVKNVARYIGFSSGSICDREPERCSMGTKLNTLVDVVPSIYSKRSKRFKGYAVTEGKFKALHLARRGYMVLNVRGVGNWKDVLPMLEHMKAKGPVTIAFDADAAINSAVARASASLGKALMNHGYEVLYMTWDINDGKGIDDLCNAGRYGRVKLLPADQYMDEVLGLSPAIPATRCI